MIRPHTVFVDDPVKPKIPQRSATMDNKTMNSPKIPPRVHSQRSFDDPHSRPQLRIVFKLVPLLLLAQKFHQSEAFKS